MYSYRWIVTLPVIVSHTRNTCALYPYLIGSDDGPGQALLCDKDLCREEAVALNFMFGSIWRGSLI